MHSHISLVFRSFCTSNVFDEEDKHTFHVSSSHFSSVLLSLFVSFCDYSSLVCFSFSPSLPPLALPPPSPSSPSSLPPSSSLLPPSLFPSFPPSPFPFLLQRDIRTGVTVESSNDQKKTNKRPWQFGEKMTHALGRARLGGGGTRDVKTWNLCIIQTESCSGPPFPPSGKALSGVGWTLLGAVSHASVCRATVVETILSHCVPRHFLLVSVVQHSFL